MTVDPASVLVFPKPDETLDTFNKVSGFTEWVSPSSWLGWLAEKLLGQNPWEEASRMIAGDWKMVSESGVAVEHLAKFNLAYANALKEQTDRLFGQQFWTGKAATDGANYFRDLEQTLRAQIEPLEDLAYQIKKMTVGVNQTADRIKGLLEDLTDALISLGIGSAVTAGTVVVASKVSWAARRVLRLGKEIIKAYDEALDFLKTVVGLAAGDLADVRAKNFKQLSPTGFDHLGVAPPKPKQVVPPPVSAGPSSGAHRFSNPDDEFFYQRLD